MLYCIEGSYGFADRSIRRPVFVITIRIQVHPGEAERHRVADCEVQRHVGLHGVKTAILQLDFSAVFFKHRAFGLDNNDTAGRVLTEQGALWTTQDLD